MHLSKWIRLSRRVHKSPYLVLGDLEGSMKSPKSALVMFYKEEEDIDRSGEEEAAEV